MNSMEKILPRPATDIAIADDAGALEAFLDPGCAALLWRRQTPPEVQTWLDELAPEKLPRGRVVLRANALHQTLTHLCDAAGTPAGPERDWLQSDIAELADAFVTLIPAEYMRLRLGVVTNNACRKFHVDAITARLVCTYRGPGTQYGINQGDDAPEPLHAAPAGAPLLLKGSIWPGERPSDLLHRSPPIEGTGQSRLVLVLDPVYDPENEV